MSISYSIYALVHPLDEKARYVGLSKNPTQRFQQHLRKAPIWIQELRATGLEPLLSILETDIATLEEARKRERHWIHRYEGMGHVLENLVHNEGALRERSEAAQLQQRLEAQYADFPHEQAAYVIEITKGAYQHVGVCAWEDAFSSALFTAQELEKNGMLSVPLDIVEIAMITLRQWNLHWSRSDEYRKGGRA